MCSNGKLCCSARVSARLLIFLHLFSEVCNPWKYPYMICVAVIILFRPWFLFCRSSPSGLYQQAGLNSPRLTAGLYQRDSVTRYFASGFFHESVSPQPQSIPLGPFQIFSKIPGDIRKSRCTTGINVTDGKFATGINDTGSKFCHQFR